MNIVSGANDSGLLVQYFYSMNDRIEWRGCSLKAYIFNQVQYREWADDTVGEVLPAAVFSVNHT